jgi:type IV fimbrial biogenesis protein FimT
MITRAMRLQAGFTMVEMMIVVFIIAILSALAVPSMKGMIRTQQVKTISFDIFASLTLARSEAIKRNINVTMAPLAGGWATGWTVTDGNGNVLRDQQYTSGLANITLTGPANVVYNSAGRLTAGAIPLPFVLTFTNLDDPAEADRQERCVMLDLSGRPRSGLGKTTAVPTPGPCP